MKGTLDMGEHSIINLKPFVEDDSSQAASRPLSPNMANQLTVTFTQQRGDLKMTD